MVDDNRFDGLGDQLGDESDDDPAPADSDTEPATEPEPMDTRQVADSTTTDDSAKDTPAFDFDAANQTPIYPRGETMQDFEDALDFDVRRALRDDGFTEITKRELHEAALRALVNKPELITESFRELRGGDGV